MSYFQFVKENYQNIHQRDPSLKSRMEIFFFPGFKALNTWYVAHRLYKKGHYGLARYLSLRAQSKTGIDIHPGAQIGRNLFIDHGSGVVIGETCIIGNDVTIFQGVTLGATGKVTGKRHPTICDGAVIGAGAKVIGAIIIGKEAKIGAGSIIIKDVPPYTTMVPLPAHAVRYKNEKLPVLTLKSLSEDMNRKMHLLFLNERVLQRRMDRIESASNLNK